MGVTVKVDGTKRAVDEGRAFTFGRAMDCTACLNRDDVGVSRRAGSIEREAGTWWLVNRSTTRPLSVISELGLRNVLAPGRRMALEERLTVVIEGAKRRYAIEVVPDDEPGGPPNAEAQDGLSTASGAGVLVNEADRLALVALFAGYLRDFPHYDPHPRTYEAAAVRLGWPRTTLVKRIEYLRTRLTKAGVPNLAGPNALENLAEYVLTTGVLTKEDLRLLRC